MGAGVGHTAGMVLKLDGRFATEWRERVLAEEKVTQYSTQPLTWDLVNP